MILSMHCYENREARIGIREAAKTALAYREMLERARKTLQDAWEDEGSTTVGKQILETIKAIDELLKGE